MKTSCWTLKKLLTNLWKVLMPSDQKKFVWNSDYVFSVKSPNTFVFTWEMESLRVFSTINLIFFREIMQFWAQIRPRNGDFWWKNWDLNVLKIMPNLMANFQIISDSQLSVFSGGESSADWLVRLLMTFSHFGSKFFTHGNPTMATFPWILLFLWFTPRFWLQICLSLLLHLKMSTARPIFRTSCKM